MDILELSQITPDQVVLWSWRGVSLNVTIVTTWIIMALLVLGAWLATRRLSTDEKISRWQNLLEVVVGVIRDQIREIGQHPPGPYLPFIATLFIFIGFSNLLAILPAYAPPTASLSTTAALSLCVFVAVPIYGVADQGLFRYLKQYFEPTVFMLPFNVVGELSRTLALAVRLFGNVMSGGKIVAILLAVTPFVFPVVMHALGLLTGLIQAYIFTILAMVYIASATRAHAGEVQGKEND